jgi:hypothetical protein
MKQGCLSIYRREPSFESDNDAAAFQVSMIRLCFYASLFGGSQLHSIDEFVDAELLDYNHKMTRYASRLQQSNKAPPKTPSLLHDRLSSNDWSIIASYIAILKPCKVATMKLQGNVSMTVRHGTAVKGGI